MEGLTPKQREEVEHIFQHMLSDMSTDLKDIKEAMIIIAPFVDGIKGSKIYAMGFKWIAGIIITAGALPFAIREIYHFFK